MSYQQRENSGALFRNERKNTEKHPDYTGNLNISGQSFELAAWIRKSQGGKTFMSLSVKPAQERREAAPLPSNFDESSDIPF